MKLRRIVSLFLALCLLAALAACGKPSAQPANSPSPAPAETPAPSEAPAAPQPTETPEVTEAPKLPGEALTVEYTDDTGRTLTIPAEISRVAVTGPMSQIVLFALAPEKMIAVANAWDAGAEAYFAPAGIPISMSA